ncbi:MAG TPA: isochorismatase family protein [Gallionellaceae bacterium]|nr:isochorismatase family protein [Gallionellaceae bacterium]
MMDDADRVNWQPQQGDALLVTDIQNDFLPGGSLAVQRGDEVVPLLNRYIDLFVARKLPVFATRDWHPEHHCSFREQGGPWPPHCVAGTRGAEFAAALLLPLTAVIISKATTPEQDAYSSFLGTELERKLRDAGVKRLFIGGLTTDYCILNSTRDALRLGYQVFVLADAIRAVDVQPGDGARAVEEMVRQGAQCITLQGFTT